MPIRPLFLLNANDPSPFPSKIDALMWLGWGSSVGLNQLLLVWLLRGPVVVSYLPLSSGESDVHESAGV